MKAMRWVVDTGRNEKLEGHDALASQLRAQVRRGET